MFSVSNAKAGHENRHFHVYIRPEGVLGCEIRNESAMNYGFKAANAVKADYKGKPAENIIAASGRIRKRNVSVVCKRRESADGRRRCIGRIPLYF